MFKKGVDVLEMDLRKYSVWSTFYEPDELELLEELGIDIYAFEAEIEKIGNVDDYWYPVPDAAISMPFKYLYLSSNITTPNGTKLVGYRTRVSLTVLHEGKRYFFNKAAVDLCKPQEQALSSSLNEQSIFPLSVHIIASNTNEQFNYLYS